MAHKLALASDLVEGDMIEAMEFQDLSREHNVYGVPKTVINDRGSFEGALPEARFVTQIRKALVGVATD